MPTTLVLPTEQEMNEAVEVMVAEGPVPLARLVDEVKPLQETLQGIVDQTWPRPMLVAKSCFVLGLRLGLTIQARRQKEPPPK